MTLSLKKCFLITTLIVLYSGCSEKTNALRYFKDQNKTINSIQYTKKVDLLSNKQNELVVIASYLNKIDKEYENKNLNSFLVSVQLLDKQKGDYELLLNGKKPDVFEEIEKESGLVSKIALKNYWAKYYLVKFKSNKKQKQLKLEIAHKNLGRKFITFSK